MDEEKLVYGAVKMEEELVINFPPMGPNFDLRSISIWCTSFEKYKAEKKKGRWLTPNRDKEKKKEKESKKKGEGERGSSEVLSQMKDKIPSCNVVVKIRIEIGPNKLRIPLFEEGSLDLKGTFEVFFFCGKKGLLNSLKPGLSNFVII